MKTIDLVLYPLEVRITSGKEAKQLAGKEYKKGGALTIDHTEDGYILVLLFTNRIEFVIHELYHVVRIAQEFLGFDDKSQEAEAYLMQYLYCEYTRLAKVKRKVDNVKVLGVDID